MRPDGPELEYPIFASELAHALEFALEICPKANEQPSCAFVAIVPDPDPGRHRALITARNGRVWAGAFVHGDGLHRVALSHASAAHTLARLKAEVKLEAKKLPRVEPHEFNRLTWQVVSDDINPVVVRLEDYIVPWDVSSRAKPATFPAGWQAPRVAPALTGTPVHFSSDVLALASSWPGTAAAWWLDPRTELARFEFTSGDWLAAFMVVVPRGRKAIGLRVERPEQDNIPGTAPSSEETFRKPFVPPATDPKTPASDLGTEDAAGLRSPSEGDASADAPEKAPEIKVPDDISDAVVDALQLGSEYYRAVQVHETAVVIGTDPDQAHADMEFAGRRYWSRFEKLTESERALCTELWSQPEVLLKVLEDRSKREPPAQPELPIEAAAAKPAKKPRAAKAPDPKPTKKPGGKKPRKGSEK